MGDISNTTENNSVRMPSSLSLEIRNLYTQKITVGSMEVGDLPTEIILKILHYLPLGATFQVCRVNKRLFSLFSTPSLWSHYCDKEYGTRVEPLLAQHTYRNYLCRYGYKRRRRRREAGTERLNSVTVR